MLTDPRELARLDDIATARVIREFFWASHPDYAPAAAPEPLPAVTAADCAAMDDMLDEVTL